MKAIYALNQGLSINTIKSSKNACCHVIININGV